MFKRSVPGPSFSALLTVFLASQCQLCDRTANAILCPSCQRQLQQCQLSTPLDLSIGSLPVLAWGHYRDSLKRTIAALKYEHHTDLAKPLGVALGQTWRQQAAQILSPSQQGNLIVVPIPLHPERQQQRGFNQAELMAQWFCRVTGLPLAAHGLSRVTSTTAQHHLGRHQRRQNLATAFALGRDFQTRRPTRAVLLLDDIYTTGATVESAADLLRRQGISVAGVGAVARSMLSAAPTNSCKTPSKR